MTAFAVVNALRMLAPVRGNAMSGQFGIAFRSVVDRIAAVLLQRLLLFDQIERRFCHVVGRIQFFVFFFTRPLSRVTCVGLRWQRGG